MNILFVCTGNTCRSPMAEGIMRKLCTQKGLDICVLSAGLDCLGAEQASEYAIQAMEEMDIDIRRHVPKTITPALVQEADLVLTMTGRHKQYVETFLGGKGKTYTLLEYVNGQAKDVSDPFGGSPAVYKACAQELYAAIEALCTILKEH